MTSPALADLVPDSWLLRTGGPDPPVLAGHGPAVFLLDAATGLEDRILRRWIAAHRLPGEVCNIAPSRIRRRSRPTEARLASLAETDERWFVPLRVMWLPSERHGRRSASWLDVLKLGDPRDPRWFRDYLILMRHPDRVRVVAGEGASAEQLREGHRRESAHLDLAEYVAGRAWRSLDRAEREVRGNRYKIPRFVAEDIARRPEFRQRAIELGAERHLSPEVAVKRARYYLSEIAASHSPFLIDLIANLIHWVIRQGYGEIHYDRAVIAEIDRLGRHHPLVFLPSHKSNLDRLSLQYVLWENDRPPNHTAGGINMNFFPVGPLVRRTGVFYIRRSFKGNELYKFVLRTYLDYLMERRFPLEWYIEGGRSRSGKLRPPRYGMLSWVVDSLARGKVDDIYLLPISIAYDQIQEVGAYVTEATGGEKEKETFSWAVKFARSLRRRYGDIHIRFAEPISVARELTGKQFGDDDSLEIQKLAFEVMYRISQVTPITPIALVSTVFLAAKDGALSLDDATRGCRELSRYAERRRLPTTGPLPASAEETERTIELMAEHDLISSIAAAGRTGYWMTGPQKLRASYYANTVVHFFVPRALAEIALSFPERFWEDVFELRDLLKFEFFFAEKDAFRQELEAEMQADDPEWEAKLADGRSAEVSLRPRTAAWAVLPILEAYRVAADELADTEGPVEEKAFLRACLDRGRLYRIEGVITSDESVTQVLYSGALALARNRGLAEGGAEVAHRRRALAAELTRYQEAATPG